MNIERVCKFCKYGLQVSKVLSQLKDIRNSKF